MSSIVNALRRAIVSGYFSPNEHLIELELAQKLDTNRGNVRTALVVLENEGLVTRVPHRGARVRRVSAAEALEIAEVRIPLERMVAQKAARNATPEDGECLRQIAARLKEEFDAENYLAMPRLNASLHARILTIAASPTLERVLSNLKHRLVREQYARVIGPSRAAGSLKEHTKIVDAIVARDEAAAGQAMEDHLRSVMENLRRVSSLEP